MEDRDYFDFLHQGWSKTTGANDSFWMPEEDHGGGFDLFAVDENQEKKWIASHLSEEDISFIVAVHGSWPDLFRRLHSALDEADRLDRERDEQETRIFNLELQVDDLKGKLEGK